MLKQLRAFLVLPVICCFLASGCGSKNQEPVYSNSQTVSVYDDATGYFKMNGFIQGTTYSIVYKSEQSKDYSKQVETLLKDFDRSLSNYDSTSIISRINNNDDGVVPDSLFLDFVSKSLKIYEMTNGAFDVTVAPVVNAWGFGFSDSSSVTEELIDSLLQKVGSDKISLENGVFLKRDSSVTLIGNAIAQGMSVDFVANFFNQKGVADYMVEIGGELRTKGVNPKGSAWRIAVDKPLAGLEQREFFSILQLSGKAMATSGNYRKYYDKGGVRYSHTIDPRTGYPVSHSLLSATVVADDCAEADALATSFMVMGLDSAKAFLQKHAEYNSLLIYAVGDSLAMYADDNMIKYMK